MPQHKSAKKRVRQNERRRSRNRIHRSKLRTMMKRIRTIDSKDEAVTMLNEVKAYLDRLSTTGILHKNKAANYKSKLERRVNSLG